LGNWCDDFAANLPIHTGLVLEKYATGNSTV